MTLHDFSFFYQFCLCLDTQSSLTDECIGKKRWILTTQLCLITFPKINSDKILHFDENNHSEDKYREVRPLINHMNAKFQQIYPLLPIWLLDKAIMVVN